MSKRISKSEYLYVKEVLSNGFRSSKGSSMMTRLEDKFKEIFKCQFAISHINGTATMHSVLEAHGIGLGDEVIVPPLTMSSTTLAVLQANATPVYADVCYDSFLIDPKDIIKKISKNTRAIITVSLYGLSPDMDEIMKIAEENNLLVLEDNAECMLGMYKGKLVGTLGHVASYSFQSSKHITSGEGGMIITNLPDLADNVRRVSSLGYAGVGAKKGKIDKLDIQNPEYERHVTLGWNYRLPELCSAVALAQMERVFELVHTRQKAASLFLEAISNCDWLIPQSADYSHENTYWTFVVLIEHNEITWKYFRDKFVEFGGDGIYAAWKLSYDEPFFKERKFLGRENIINIIPKPDCPVADNIQPRLLQFKTNYWKQSNAVKQAKILKKTIESIEKDFVF